MDDIVLPPDNPSDLTNDEYLLENESAGEDYNLTNNSFPPIPAEETVEDIFVQNSPDMECEINMFDVNPTETYYYYNDDEGDQTDEVDHSEIEAPPLPPGCLPEDMPSHLLFAPNNLKNQPFDFPIGKTKDIQSPIPSDNIDVPSTVDNNDNSRPFNSPHINNIQNVTSNFIDAVVPLPPDPEILENIMNIPPPPPPPSNPGDKLHESSKNSSTKPDRFLNEINAPSIALPPPQSAEDPPEEKPVLDEDSRLIILIFFDEVFIYK